MNVRNELKAQIVRAGMTMQEVVDQLSEEYGWSDSVSNLSAKLQRESIRYKEVLELADVLGYEIVWQKKREYSCSRPHLHAHPIPPRILRPHDEIRRVQRGRSERMQRTSLRQRTVVTALLGWEITAVRAVELQSGYRLQATAAASAEAAFPVPPRESPRYFAAVG